MKPRKRTIRESGPEFEVRVRGQLAELIHRAQGKPKAIQLIERQMK